MKARARPEALGISFVESFSQPKEVDELYEDDGEDVSEDPDPPQELERRRPSLVIAGDASALESVRTVHSPKAARVLGNLSPRGFARSPAKPLPPASPRGGAAPPSPIRTLIEDDEPMAADDSIGWRAAWTAKLSSARGQIDLVGTLLLVVYCYHDCLNEPNECHEDCLADPNSCLLLPAIIASAAVGLFVLYGYAQPAAMFEWAQTTMVASCIQRVAPLGTIALVASNEENLALVSDGTAAAFAGFLVCRARLPWPLVFLALTMASSAIDGIVRSSSAVEAGSVVLGLAIVWSAHFVVATLRRLTKLDGAVPSLAISAKKCV